MNTQDLLSYNLIKRRDGHKEQNIGQPETRIMKAKENYKQLSKRSTDSFCQSFSSLFANHLRGSLPKSGPLDFATKNTFPLFFVGEEALVGVY